MTGNNKLSRLGVTLLIAVVTFVFAMVYDQAAVRPHLQALRNLEQQKDQTHRSLVEQVQRRQQCHELAELLGVSDLADVAVPDERDAVTYVSELLGSAGVQILDLGVTDSKRFGRVSRTDVVVRASGKYGALVSFVRGVETGERLARIEDFEIEPSLETGKLEGRFTLALFDPIVRTKP